MSSIRSNVVDLAGSPSPMKSMPIGHDRVITRSRMKRSRRIGQDNQMSNNGGNNTNGEPEIIDLRGDSPPSLTMGSPRRRRKRPRPLRAATSSNEMEDDDVVEIISPPVAKNAAAAASRKRPCSINAKNWVDRIREVFPLVSRAKVEIFLAMARSYSTEDTSDDVFYAVMSVLSEDPIGMNVTEASFAAAAIRNRFNGDQSVAPNTTKSGNQKVAQLECQCCYVDYDYEEMVSCKGGHLFCKTCLQKHTEQRVFGVGNLGVKLNSTNGSASTKNASKALEILCMASDCTLGFHEGQLRKACSEKVLAKYDEMQYAAVVESANIEGIAKCPKCNFIAISDPAWPSMMFRCSQCNFKSCKECGEEYHPNIRCDQVETKNETDGRKVVEEAMTTAMIRTCPRPFCRKKFLKNDGCNKMTCSCGCFICYVCRKEIPPSVAYKHFCQTPHCSHTSCGLCPLYANTDAADKARVRNAAQKAARQVKNQVRVDVNSLLKEPPRHHNQRR